MSLRLTAAPLARRRNVGDPRGTRHLTGRSVFERARPTFIPMLHEPLVYDGQTARGVSATLAGFNERDAF